MTPTLDVGTVVTQTPNDFTSPHTITLTAGAASGDKLIVAVGDGYGFNSSVTAISDSQGNTYVADVVANQAGGDGSVYVYSSVLTTALSAGDTLSVSFSNSPWPYATFHAVAFSGVGALAVAGTPVGGHTVTSMSATVTPTAAGQLLIGLAAWHGGTSANDAGWTAIVTDEGGDDGSYHSRIDLAYKISSDTSLATYTATNGSTIDYGAIVALAYAPGEGGGGGGGTIPPVAGSIVVNKITIGTVRRGRWTRPA